MIFNIITGKLPILFSAPHAFPHLRPKSSNSQIEDSKLKLKKRDSYTDKLADQFARELNCYAFYTTTIQRDPNWYRDSKYRIAVLEYIRSNDIKFFIDIHGLAKTREAAFWIITNREDRKGTQIAKKIQEQLARSFGTIELRKFKNDQQLTLCEDVYEKIEVPAIELEINYKVRKSKADITATMRSLKKVLIRG
jgi:hypothetical protein